MHVNNKSTAKWVLMLGWSKKKKKGRKMGHILKKKSITELSTLHTAIPLV